MGYAARIAMARRTDKWLQAGPLEAEDEAIHTRVICRSCGNLYGEYRLAARPGVLLPVGHETNELPPEPGWVRVSPRRGGRGRLTGAGAYTIEEFEGKRYLRWQCGGRYDRRCGASPKVEWSRLVSRVRRSARQSPERPIEIAL